jgi:glycosyltransferase involved in cell wall biosynthesis
MKQQLFWLFPHLEQDGGGTKFLLEVTKRLTRTYDVTVLCNTAKPEIAKSFRINKVKVITTSSISANSNVYWLCLPLLLAIDYLRYIRHLKNADYILSTMYPSNFIAFVYTTFTNKHHYHYCFEPFPYLHDKHFMKQQPFAKRIFMQIFAMLYAWTDIIAVKKAKTVFTLNDITKRMIKRVYKIEAVITKMGVDTRHFRHYTNTKVARKYASTPLIIHATDYSQMKRTDLAIVAFNEVVKQFPSTLLLITSTYPDSPHKKRYEDLVHACKLDNNVIFLDYVSYKELPYYYSAARCYLSCSYDEMLGTTSSNLPVKEALACETPAIRAPVTREDVEDAISGYLIDPRKTRDVARKLQLLISDPTLSRSMGKNGRKTIIKNYSWDRVSTIIRRHLS